MSELVVLTTALDTSVIIAALLSWHQHHEPAFRELSALLEGEGKIVLPLPALVEAYSVMTRLPPPRRLSPQDASELLSGSLRERVTVVTLEAEEAWDFISSLSCSLVSGGTSYDGLILACAKKSRAERLLTLNRSHFERIAAGEIEIVVPS